MTNQTKTTDYLAKYCSYINSSGNEKIKTKIFDEDWDPVGYQVRNDLMANGLAYQMDGISANPRADREIYLTSKGFSLALNEKLS